jgi:hypothetical protein
MTNHPDLPTLEALGSDATALFDARYKAAVAAYKALPESQRQGVRDPVRGKGDIRFGFALAYAALQSAALATRRRLQEVEAREAALPTEAEHERVRAALDRQDPVAGKVAALPKRDRRGRPPTLRGPEGKGLPQATMGVVEGVATITLPRTRDEQIADLDRRDAALEKCAVCGAGLEHVTETRKSGARAGKVITYRRCPNRKSHPKLPRPGTAVFA